MYDVIGIHIHTYDVYDVIGIHIHTYDVYDVIGIHIHTYDVYDVIGIHIHTYNVYDVIGIYTHLPFRFLFLSLFFCSYFFSCEIMFRPTFVTFSLSSCNIKQHYTYEIIILIALGVRVYL